MNPKQIILDKIGELKMILNETEYIHVFLPESPVRIHAKIEVLESILPLMEEEKESEWLNTKQMARVSKMLKDCAMDAWDAARESDSGYLFQQWWKQRNELHLNKK